MSVKWLQLTDGCMSSSGLKTMNFQNMTKDNKQTEPLDSTKPAIAYTHCCVSGAVLNNKTFNYAE